MKRRHSCNAPCLNDYWKTRKLVSGGVTRAKGLGNVTLLTNIFLTSRLPKYFFKTVRVHREYQNNMYSQISLCIFGQIIMEDVFFFVFLAIFLI